MPSVLRSSWCWRFHYGRWRSLARILCHWVDGPLWEDRDLCQGTSEAQRLSCVRHSHRCTGVCDTVRRSECYPSRTIVRLSSRTCIWSRWSLCHASDSLSFRRPSLPLNTSSRLGLAAWSLTLNFGLGCSLSYRQSTEPCTWSIDNRQAWIKPTSASYRKSRRSDLWVSGPCQCLHTLHAPPPYRISFS